MAITQYDPVSGYMIKRFRDSSGRLMPIERTASGTIMPSTTQSGPFLKPTGATNPSAPQYYDSRTGRVIKAPKNIMNIGRLLNSPTTLRAMGLIPGLGVGAGLLGAGSLAYSLLANDDSPEGNTANKILEARETKPWVDRALNPYTKTTDNNETVRTAHDKHSKTGKFIVYPTIRNVNGELIKYTNEEAKRIAEKRGDFISFNNEKSALNFSMELSNAIGAVRDRKVNRGLLM